jgi:hypothetical protein
MSGLWAFVASRFSWAAALLLGAAAIYAGHLVDVHRHEVKARQAGRDEIQARWDAAEKLRAIVAAKAEAAARFEEQRRQAAQKEVTDEALRIASRDRVAAAALAAAAPGLRGAVTSAITGGGFRPSDSALALGGQAAGTTRVLLADVLGPAEQRLRDLAKAADDARGAGEACERAYDALNARSGAEDLAQ